MNILVGLGQARTSWIKMLDAASMAVLFSQPLLRAIPWSKDIEMGSVGESQATTSVGPRVGRWLMNL